MWRRSINGIELISTYAHSLAYFIFLLIHRSILRWYSNAIWCVPNIAIFNDFTSLASCLPFHNTHPFHNTLFCHHPLHLPRTASLSNSPPTNKRRISRNGNHLRKLCAIYIVYYLRYGYVRVNWGTFVWSALRRIAHTRNVWFVWAVI